MSQASLQEQLRAVASQLSDTFKESKVPEKKVKPDHGGAKSNEASKRPPKKQSAFPHKKVTEKPKWLQYAHQGIELLQQHFPNCFKKKQLVQPLKVGIKLDLVKRLQTMEMPADEKACMVKSLSYYVNLLSYHKQIQVGSKRVDLDGEIAGEVSEKEAKYSAAKVEARLASKKNSS